MVTAAQFQAGKCPDESGHGSLTRLGHGAAIIDRHRWSVSMKTLLTTIAVAGLCLGADGGIFNVAPPPPASWHRDRAADLSARRKALMDRIGPNGILILFAAEPRNYANDVDWPYRQENDFFYLTGLTQPGATLVLAPGTGKMREMVFVPRPVPS